VTPAVQEPAPAARAHIAAQARALRPCFAGDLLLPDDPAYDTARRVWNPMVDRYPALIARCAGREDVAAAVRFARGCGLEVSIRGSGHSFPGLGVWDDALMIDLSGMKDIHLFPSRRRAVAQAGLTWGEFNLAAQAFGLATTGADVATVGIAGMTLGGGLGWLHRVYGLTCDNLLSAEVVLADGRTVRASDDEYPDLFWGLRGGGGNFGIVTSFEYRLHPLREVLGGIVVHPLERARDALRLYRELCAGAPDALRLAALLITAPPARFIPEELRGRMVVFLGAAYFGPLAEGERALRPLREFGPPLVDRIRPIRYADLQLPSTPSELYHHSKGEFLRRLDDAAIEALAAGAERAAAPFTLVLLNQLGGAMSRVPEETTSFAYRHAAHTLGIHAMWRPGEDGAQHVAWAEELWEALQPCSAGGAYVNHLGLEGERRIQAAYGPAKYARLAALKATYDPDNFFRINQNIKPQPPEPGQP
jgi:FAD/FMN-containing dehydrogenase